MKDHMDIVKRDVEDVIKRRDFRIIFADPISDTEILDRTLVAQCPKMGMRDVWAADSCPKCPYFRGLVQNMPDEQVDGFKENGTLAENFGKCYHILCAAPMKRSLRKMEVVVAE